MRKYRSREEVQDKLRKIDRFLELLMICSCEPNLLQISLNI